MFKQSTQSIVNAGVCKELNKTMQDHVFMFAETITLVEMFLGNVAKVFCLSGDVYSISERKAGGLLVKKELVDSEDGHYEY